MVLELGIHTSSSVQHIRRSTVSVKALDEGDCLGVIANLAQVKEDGYMSEYSVNISRLSKTRTLLLVILRLELLLALNNCLSELIRVLFGRDTVSNRQYQHRTLQDIFVNNIVDHGLQDLLLQVRPDLRPSLRGEVHARLYTLCPQAIRCRVILVDEPEMDALVVANKRSSNLRHQRHQSPCTVHSVVFGHRAAVVYNMLAVSFLCSPFCWGGYTNIQHWLVQRNAG